MRPSVTFIFMILATALQAGSRVSTNYSVPTETVAGGGSRSTSAIYTNVGNFDDVVAISTAVSPAVTAKNGFIGQLSEVTGLELAASPATVNEALTRQVTAKQVLDDGTTLAVAASGVSWSVVSGPLTGVDTNGVVTAGKVYTDTVAVVQGTFLAHTDSIDLTILEVAVDLVAFDGGYFSVNEESGSVMIPIVRTGSTDGTVTVNFSTSSVGSTATAGGDYAAVTDQLVSFAHGESLKLVSVPILAGDAPTENNETITLVLTSPGPGTTLGNPSTATLRIIDTVDSTVPSAPTITSHTAGQILNLATGQQITLSGAAADDKGVGSVKVKINSSGYAEAVLDNPGDPNTNWSYTYVPPNGPNAISVQNFDTRNNASTVATRSISVLKQLVINNSDSTLGTLSAATGFREVGKSYTITATPKATGIFAGWSVSGGPALQQLGIVNSSLQMPSLTFNFREGLVLTANFENNPYDDSGVAGTYNGLIHASTDPGDNSFPGLGTEGYFTATVLNTGAFSGRMTIDGFVLNVAGVFDQQGRARFGTARALTQTVARTGKPSLVVKFDIGGPGLSVAPPAQITGRVEAKQFLSSAVPTSVSFATARRAHFNGLTQALTVPDEYLKVTGTATSPTGRTDGVFTVVLLSVPVGSQPLRVSSVLTERDYPKGHGLGTLRVTKAGAVSFTGSLADGTPVTSTLR